MVVDTLDIPQWHNVATISPGSGEAKPFKEWFSFKKKKNRRPGLD
jgi:hypothetical protein